MATESMTVDEIASRAMELSSEQRAELVQRLLENFEPPGDLSPGEWSSACSRLIDERLAAVDRGEFVDEDWRTMLGNERNRIGAAGT